MVNKKFEFTGEEKTVDGVLLKRIRAKNAFGIVAKGEVGGFIEAEKNLNSCGNAWVSGDARVTQRLQRLRNQRTFSQRARTGNPREESRGVRRIDDGEGLK